MIIGERRKLGEGSLDWWMQLQGEPTFYERVERARLVLLIVRTWDEARKFPEPQTNQNGFPANQVCGNLVDAAAALLGVPSQDAVRMLDNWTEMATEQREARLKNYFRKEWTR